MEKVEICGVRALVARRYWERMRGLIGRERPARGEGMLILRCNCVHTCFMGYAIDVTFLDGRDRVVKEVRNVRPWRLWVWGGWRARKVLETASRGLPDLASSIRQPASGVRCAGGKGIRVDEAVPLKLSKWGVLGLVTAGYALLQGIRGVPGAVMPGIRSEYAGVPDGDWGMVMGTFAATYGAAVLFGGVAGDVLGHRRILKLSAALFSLACGACGFAGWWGTDPVVFLAVAFGVAFAAGQSLYPASAAALASALHEKARATALSVMQGAYYVAAVAVACGAGWLAGRGAGGWREPFWLLGGIGLALAVVMAWALRGGDGGGAKAGGEGRAKAGEAFAAFAREPAAWLLTVAFGCMTFANLGYAAWGPMAIGDAFFAGGGGNAAGAAAFHAVAWHYLGCAAGIAVASRWSDRWAAVRGGKVRPLVNAAGLAVAGVGLWAAFRGGSLAWCGAWLFLFGAGRGIYDSNMCAALFEVVPGKYRGAATGFMCFGAFLTGCTGPKALGLMRDAGMGHAAAFGALAAVLAAGAVAATGAWLILTKPGWGWYNMRISKDSQTNETMAGTGRKKQK